MEDGAGEVAELGLELAERSAVDPLGACGAMSGLRVGDQLEDSVPVERNIDPRFVVERAQERGIEIAPSDREVAHGAAGKILALGSGRQHAGAGGRCLAESLLPDENHRGPAMGRLGSHG